MAKLVHIQASPRGSRSASQAVASCFIESYLATHAGDTVDALELWRTDLPEINGTMLDAAYAVKHGQPHSPDISSRCRCGISASFISSSTTLIYSCIEG